MNEKNKKMENSGNGIGVGVAFGAVLFVLTNEPVWIALGVAIGAAFDWNKSKKIIPVSYTHLTLPTNREV